MRDKVTRQCPQTTTFVVKGEPKQIRTAVPLLTSITPYRYARPAHEILNEWQWPLIARFSFLNIHRSGVLTVLSGCYVAGAMWNCCRAGTCFVHTTQPCTGLQYHFKQGHVRWVSVCLAVTGESVYLILVAKEDLGSADIQSCTSLQHHSRQRRIHWVHMCLAVSCESTHLILVAKEDLRSADSCWMRESSTGWDSGQGDWLKSCSGFTSSHTYRTTSRLDAVRACRQPHTHSLTPVPLLPCPSYWHSCTVTALPVLLTLLYRYCPARPTDTPFQTPRTGLRHPSFNHCRI